MLKINIICVGSIKEKYFIEAIEEYKKRLSRFCKISIIEVEEKSQEKNEKVKIEKESLSLLNAIKGYVILLDREGKEISSEGLAQVFDNCAVKGDTEISFIIGGSNGVNEQLKRACKQIYSFGKITFPHQLFRVVLIEQIYRALTILNNLPYHK